MKDSFGIIFNATNLFFALFNARKIVLCLPAPISSSISKSVIVALRGLSGRLAPTKNVLTGTAELYTATSEMRESILCSI